MLEQDNTQSEAPTTRNGFPSGEALRGQSAQSLAVSLRHDLELLAQLDKKMFLAVASEIRKKTREVEDTMLGADHPHAYFLAAHRDDPFLDEIKSMELSENVPD